MKLNYEGKKYKKQKKRHERDIKMPNQDEESSSVTKIIQENQNIF